MFMGTEFISTMDNSDFFSNWLNHKGPINCRIPSTEDSTFLSRNLLKSLIKEWTSSSIFWGTLIGDFLG
ncbi:hypothetical protein [Niallia taxi]|uniref:hypothetical protein n=1 Tax=Niallia taxi TaxID=2499688 RepID=UPI003AB77428